MLFAAATVGLVHERASDCLACLMSAIVGLVRSRRTCDVCGSSGFGRLVYWDEFDSIGVG